MPPSILIRPSGEIAVGDVVVHNRIQPVADAMVASTRSYISQTVRAVAQGGKRWEDRDLVARRFVMKRFALQSSSLLHRYACMPYTYIGCTSRTL